MKTIEAIILVEPVPKGRPKITTFGGHARAYTPSKTRKAEDNIAMMIRQELMKEGPFDAGVPLTMTATFFVTKPTSARKRDIYPVKRPDLDNYGKLLLDALNKYVFPDDSQLIDLHLHKRFGAPPRIEIKISEVLE